MREYQLITANKGLVDYRSAHPLRGQNWTITAALDESGETGDDEAKLLTPEGEELTRVRLSDGPQVFREIRELVKSDAEVLDVIDELDRRPLICVRRMPTGPVLVTLWLSGEEFAPREPGGAADRAEMISPGPDAMDKLLAILGAWKGEFSGARVDSEVPLSELVTGPTDAEPDESVTAAGIEPAKPAPKVAVAAARAARQVGSGAPPDPPSGNPPESQAPAEAGESIREIPILQIGHFPGGNMRSRFNGIEELAETIRIHGVIQPLTVNEVDGRYILVAGERRLRAAGLAGLKTVPCRVLRVPEQQALEMMLIENLQREDPTPMEEARAYQRLLDMPGATQSTVAQRVGKSRQYVNEYLQLLRLPDELQRQVDAGTMGVKVAMAYLRQTEHVPEQVQQKVAKAIAERQPSTREAPRVIDQMLRQEGAARPEAPVSPARTLPPDVPAMSASPDPEPAPAPPAAEPEPVPLIHVDPDTARASGLAEIGRRFWSAVPGDPWSGYDFRYENLLFSRECYLPLQRVFDHWIFRGELGANTLPRGIGNTCRINIPEQRVWIRGFEQFATYPEITLEGTRLSIKLPTGGVEAFYAGNLVYYRVELRKQDQGGTKQVEQQLVIQDGGRHLVITGSGTVLMRKELVPKWEDLVNDLPGLPAGVDPADDPEPEQGGQAHETEAPAPPGRDHLAGAEAGDGMGRHEMVL